MASYNSSQNARIANQDFSNFSNIDSMFDPYLLLDPNWYLK